jgi:hypothetical protein
MTKKFSEDNLKEIYDQLFDKSAELILKYEDAQVVASTLMAQAIRLYKTILTPQEFEEMLEVVLNTSKQVEPFIFHKLH